MLTTLFAQEVRSLAPKTGVIAGIGALVIAVSLGLSSALAVPPVSGVLLIASIGTLIVVPFAMLIQVAVAYWKSMHCDAGYFTHTLPATGAQLYWAKTLFAYCVSLLSILFWIVGFLAVVWQASSMSGAAFGQIVSEVVDSWNALPLVLRALLVLSALLLPANCVFPVAAVMSIGAQGRWNHLGFGAPVIGLVLLYLIDQVAAVAGVLLLPGGIDTATGGFVWKTMLPEVVRSASSGSQVTVVGVEYIATTALVTVTVVWWGIRSLNRHLSLR